MESPSWIALATDAAIFGLEYLDALQALERHGPGGSVSPEEVSAAYRRWYAAEVAFSQAYPFRDSTPFPRFDRQHPGLQEVTGPGGWKAYKRLPDESDTSESEGGGQTSPHHGGEGDTSSPSGVRA